MAGFKRSSIYKSSLFNTFVLDNEFYVDKGRLRAFEINDKVKIVTYISSSANDVFMLIKSDNGQITKKIDLVLEDGKYVGYLDIHNLFGDYLGLYKFKFFFKYNNTEFELSESDDKFNDSIRYVQRDAKNSYNLFIYKKRENEPDWMYGGIIYQIFPDRFFKGREEPVHKDAIIEEDWYNGIPPYKAKPGEKFKNNTFFGGDLYGIADKLDYISSLGVTCIYLTPIFKSFSNHRYDTGDYNTIDEMLGGEEGLKFLLSEAKKRNISVILDGVFNHTGADSVYFNKYNNYDSIGAYNSKESKYYNWYNFYDYPDNYESWWGFESLPRVKSDNPEYKEFLFGENGIIRKYIRMGISGYRLDVVDEVSDSFLEELKSSALVEKKDAYVVGEVWENAITKVSYGNRRTYFNGKELDSVMNYPLRNAIISYLRDSNIYGIINIFEHIYNEYPVISQNLNLNLLSSHDTVRIITSLVDELPENLSRDEQAIKKLDKEKYNEGISLVKFGYIISNFIPGIPTIYYGDEIGMEGYTDPFNRRAFQWGKENNNLLDFYKKMGEIRKNHSCFKNELSRLVYIDNDILCIERGEKDKPLIAIINKSNDSYTLSGKVDFKNLFTGEYGKSLEINSKEYLILECTSDPGDYSVFKNRLLEEDNDR